MEPYPSHWRHFQANKAPRTLPPTTHEQRRRRGHCGRVLLPYLKEYCDTASIHGVRYLTDPRMQRFEKAIWLLIILGMTFGAVFVYVELSELYLNERIQTTVADSVHPVFFVPFPSVGVCPRNRLDWPKLQNAHRVFLPANASALAIATFRSFFEHLEDFRFGRFKNIADLFAAGSPTAGSGSLLQLIDHVDVLSVMRHLSFSCETVFAGETCYWRRRAYGCCDLFTLQHTEVGFCYVFNSLIDPRGQQRAKKEKFYPYHNSKSGEGSGLEFDIRLDESKQRPGFSSVNGVYFMLKQTDQWSEDVRFINSNTYTKVAITAQVSETDPKTASVPPEVRQCLFEADLKNPKYQRIPGLTHWRGNCRTRCHQEYVLKYCHCNLSLFFPRTPLDNFTDCRPTDFECIYQHEDIFSSENHLTESNYINDIGSNSMICTCMNNCNQLRFDYTFTSVPLEGINASDDVKKIHVDIHYQTDTIIKYTTHMRFTFVELLASFGGIMGLFLGASLLSAVELLYQLTIGLYVHLRKEYGGSWWCIRGSNGRKETKVPKLLKVQRQDLWARNRTAFSTTTSRNSFRNT